jgi:hypothetical protein
MCLTLTGDLKDRSPWLWRIGPLSGEIVKSQGVAIPNERTERNAPHHHGRVDRPGTSSGTEGLEFGCNDHGADELCANFSAQALANTSCGYWNYGRILCDIGKHHRICANDGIRMNVNGP